LLGSYVSSWDPRNEVSIPKTKSSGFPVVRDQYVGNHWCCRMKSAIIRMKEAQKQLVGTLAPIRVWRRKAIRRKTAYGNVPFLERLLRTGERLPEDAVKCETEVSTSI